MAFPHAQNPTFVNCSFSEHIGNNNTYQNSTTGQPSGALQILWNAISPGAAYDSEERYPPARCMPHTRVDTIKNIDRWVDGRTPILWLHGPAGAGKSAVAQTTCEKWAEAGLLLASFFISRTAPTRNTLDRVILTIAFQVVLALSGRLDPILLLIENDPSVLRRDVGIQLEKLLIGPLKELLGNGLNRLDRKAPVIIVIDGVDECTGDKNQLRLLSLILSLLDPKHVLPLRFLIVSRPESHITHAFNNLLKSVSSVESLYGAMEDVYKYLEVEFARIHDSEPHCEMMQYIPKPWPGHKVIQELTSRSDGYFIYAATIVRHVDEEGYFCVDRLNEILDHDRGSRAPGSYPYRELDKVYSQVLSKAQKTPILKRILGCIIVKDDLINSFPFGRAISTPLLINALFSLRSGEFKMALRGFHSIVSLTYNGPLGKDDVGFYHASFADYLLDQERSGEYYINREAVIQEICLSSLRLLWNPAGSEQSTPSLEWLAGIICWTTIGCPGELLAGHLRENISFLPSIIESSKYWDKDAQILLLSQFCNMIIIFKDSGSAKEIVDALSEMGQSAFAAYLLDGNEPNAWKCIQDVCALEEMHNFQPFRFFFFLRFFLIGSESNLRAALQFSPAEDLCVDHLLQWDRLPGLDHITLMPQTIFEVQKAPGTWQSSQPIFEEIFNNFLDNEKYWGDSCRREVRKSRVRQRLAGSVEGRKLLAEIDRS